MADGRDSSGKFLPGHTPIANAGRPRGRLNRITDEVREMCQRIVADKEYRENLKIRLREGKAGQLEALIWQYAFGKPKQDLDSGNDGGAIDILVEYVSLPPGEETKKDDAEN